MSLEDTDSRPPETLVSESTEMRTQFTFVCENTQSTARSHAMREHWRERKERQRAHKAIRVTPVLLPKATRTTSSASKVHKIDGRADFTPLAQSHKPEAHTGRDGVQCIGFHHDNVQKDSPLNIIVSELLAGIQQLLSPSSLDPFDTFPVRLTSGHHKLLHHCMSGA